MSEELAQVIFRGQGPYIVDRQRLAKNMRSEGAFARKDGLRPGQPTTQKCPLPDNFISSDSLATAKTIITSPGVTIIGKRKS